jgi:hypothetical protein
LNKGEHRWQSTLGEYDELSARGIPKTGAPNLGGSIVTAGGLVFIGATNDGKFRAFDKDTGEELWMTRLPASAHATPMTYLGPKSGRQFVVVAAGGGNKYNNEYMSKLVAFALPRAGDPTEPWLISALARPRFRADYKGAEEKLPAPAPTQPVPFSHRKHTELGLKCLDCHSTATKDARASFPGVAKCMSCHRTVRTATPIPAQVTWIRVYELPDFVFFSHAKHVNAKVACADCHGPVETRDVLAKEVSTSMVSCMNCHARKNASVACNMCHDLGQ